MDKDFYDNLQKQHEAEIKESTLHYNKIQEIEKKYLSKPLKFLYKLCLLFMLLAYLYGAQHFIKTDYAVAMVVAFIVFGIVCTINNKKEKFRDEVLKNMLEDYTEFLDENNDIDTFKIHCKIDEFIERYKRDIDV